MLRHCERDQTHEGMRDEFSEAEITPEMLRAGRLALAEHDPRFDSDDEAVTRIFVAMLKAKLG